MNSKKELNVEEEIGDGENDEEETIVILNMDEEERNDIKANSQFGKYYNEFLGSKEKELKGE